MCELMGMSFARPVVASVSIQAFSERAKDNADGWGLAWYPDASVALVKQPVRWSMQHTQFLEHYPGLLSATYVAHVRQKTVGAAPTHADTHPFVRELNGREYCFAHNGTLAGDFWQRPLGRFRPVGKTDSEFVFCLLLAELESFAQLEDDWAETFDQHGEPGNLVPTVGNGCFQHARPTDEQRWKWLHRYLLRLNDYGKLNCILTDGVWMLVYHDKHGWKGLTYRNVYLHEDAQHHFADATVAVNLQAAPVNHGVIVATNPLSVEGWERFLPGEMRVLCAGQAVLTSRASVHQSSDKAVARPQAKSKSVLTSESVAAKT